MKHNLLLAAKRGFTAIVAAVCMMLHASAYDFMVDGIAYRLNGDSETATVVATSLLSADNYAGLTKAIIPAFVNSDSVTTVAVTAIDEFAFYGCSTLDTLSVPATVNQIGDRAFAYCPALKFIEVNGRNATYDSRNYCNAIVHTYTSTVVVGCATTTMNSSIRAIGAFAFAGCERLSRLQIPNSVQKIGYEAFRGCKTLVGVNIPANVKEIGYRVFADCDNLANIRVDATNNRFDARESCNGVIHTSTGTLVTGCAATTIPASVTAIGYEALSGCGALSNLVIPEPVSRIGHYALRATESLQTVDIPATVTSFGDRAFGDCTALTSIYARLEHPEQANYYELSTFEGVDTLACTVYVPEGTVDLYKATMPWKPFFHITVIPSNIPGDVNLDGAVDILDVNIVINIVLGRDDASNYDRRAYILGNDTIDVADVNALINLVLNQ